MHIYKTEKITVNEIISNFIDFFPYFKDISNHCLIYNNSKLGYVKDNNKTIAALLYREYHEFPFIWELGHIKVLEDYRSKGIGSKLLEHILLDIKQNKEKKVIVHVSESNKKAQLFYEKNRFVKEGTIKNMKLGKEDLHLYTFEFFK